MSGLQPIAHRRAMDVDLAALLMSAVGLLGLAASWVSTGSHDPALELRVSGLAAMLFFIGFGLWRRNEWVRRATVVAAGLVIHGQMGRRWLQSEVPHALLDNVRGIATGSVGDVPSVSYSSALVSLPAPETGPAALGLVLCLVLGWLVVRLMSRRVRQEFGVRQPIEVRLPQKI